METEVFTQKTGAQEELHRKNGDDGLHGGNGSNPGEGVGLAMGCQG